MELQGSQIPLNTAEKPISTRTFKVFGGIQIGLGILCGLLSIAGIVIDSINANKICHDTYTDYNSYYDCPVIWDAGTLLALDITCLFSSGWFILTGIFPFCMTDKRINNWRCLKITFMVLCIVGAATFVPTAVINGIIGAVIRSYSQGGLVPLPCFQAFIALAELVIAIVAASYCCCCSGWNNTRGSGMVYVAGNLPVNVISSPTNLVHSGVQPGTSGVVNQQLQYSLAPPSYKQ